MCGCATSWSQLPRRRTGAGGGPLRRARDRRQGAGASGQRGQAAGSGREQPGKCKGRGESVDITSKRIEPTYLLQFLLLEEKF